jgi:hypothetical protein
MKASTKRLVTILFALLVPASMTAAACGGDDGNGDGDDGGGGDGAEYALTVEDQTLDDPSTVTVDSVTTAGDDLWVVIHADEDGSPGAALGVSDLVGGSDEDVQDVTVQLDEPAEDGQTLWAMLHTDDPADGEFTFLDNSEEDTPAMVDGEVVQQSFSVSVDDGGGGDNTPAITAEDQTLAPDSAGTVSIAEATIDQPGFVVVHEEEDGGFGSVIGSSGLIETGTSSDISVELDRDAADGETLYAMLHYDQNGNEEYDGIDTDGPVTGDDDSPVLDTFGITIEDDGGGGDTPSISASDQVLPADAPEMVTVDSVSYGQAGFVVIHEADGDSFGNVIGSSELLEGQDSYEDVEIMLDRAVEDGETLYAMLHMDDGNGEYDDASTDAPVEANGEVVLDTFTVDLPSVSASDVSLNGADGDLSTVVTVDEVVSSGAGWLVVHENGCSDFGGVIGHASVDAGLNEDVSVELEQPAAAQGQNTDRCAMLHTDDGNGTYDFDGSEGSADGPVADADGNVVMDTFNASVADGTPAIRVTLSSDGSTSYNVDSVEPSIYSDDVDEDPDSDEGDLRFTFRPDWRYEIVNTVASSHPFTFQNDNEEVLLSQAEQAPLEDVESINWNEVDDQTFRFTVSDDFQNNTDLGGVLTGGNAVSVYECNVHPNMTGPVQYQ